MQASLNNNVGSSGAGAAVYSRCGVSDSTLETVNGVEYTIVFNGTLAESVAIQNPAAKQNFIIPSNGVYRIALHVQCLTNGAGAHYARILKNGAEIERTRHDLDSGEHGSIVCEYVGAFVATDVVRTSVNFPVGGYVTGGTYGGSTGTRISVTRIGS